jgi:hypothetical protein
MDASIIQGKITTLLDILSSNSSVFVVEKGSITVADKQCSALTLLNALNITETDDSLNFENFEIPKIFVSENYARRIEPDDVSKNFLVISFPHGALLYYEKQFYDFNSKELIDEVQNIISYYKLYNYLKSDDFADHHNDADEEIIIYSSGKGILKIKYPSIAPKFDIPIQKQVEKLLNAINEQQFRNYFKNSLFAVASGNQIELAQIISIYNVVLSAAKRDLEIALRQFDFEKFRDALYSQKDRFFISIRDVLSKIYGQIIGIPISITAAVFATYKIEHQHIVSALILSSFIIYVVVYLLIQWNYFKDIQDIKADFFRDFGIITKQSGLPQQDINKEYDKIDQKIQTTLFIAGSLMWAVSILGITVIIYIASQL